jgi:nucleoside-diphosphate-sugar epimerase
MKPKVIITGAGGYLGSILMRVFQARNWETEPWTRSGAWAQGCRFVLGEDVPVSSLEGVEALIHCAHDFQLTRWQEARRINSLGAQKLFAAAQAAKVPRLVFISTMSAFPGCISMYGKLKLEVEQFCLSRGVFCVRPGLLWSSEPGGIYQRLSQMVGRLPVLPIFGGGRQKLAFSHAEDLAEGLETFCCGEDPPPAGAIVTAFPQLFPFRKILETLARLQDKNPHFLPLPVWPVLSGLRLAVRLHLPVPFQSDSLISLLHQDPDPIFSNRIALREWPAA